MDHFTIQPVKSFLSKEGVGLHTTLLPLTRVCLHSFKTEETAWSQHRDVNGLRERECLLVCSKVLKTPHCIPWRGDRPQQQNSLPVEGRG